jgi:hypothetical protein
MSKAIVYLSLLSFFRTQSHFHHFFSEDFCRNLTHALLNRFIPWHTFDLELWESDPETFIIENQFSFNDDGRVRSAAISLFHDLIDYHLEVVESVCIPYFCEIAQKDIGENWSSPGSADFNLVLSKEVMYTVIGAGCYAFHPKLNSVQFSFSNFLQRILLPELQKCSLEAAKRSVLRILKGRIALLIGEWYAMDPLAKSEKYTVYSTLLSLLNDSDLAVSLSALLSMKELLESDDFSSEVFKEFEAIFFDILIRLMRNLSNLDLKHLVLKTLALLILKMKNLVRLFRMFL